VGTGITPMCRGGEKEIITRKRNQCEDGIKVDCTGEGGGTFRKLLIECLSHAWGESGGKDP